MQQILKKTIKEKIILDKDVAFNFLTSKKIMSKIFFQPIHTSKFFRRIFQNQKYQLPVTEKISNTILSLPMYPDLSYNDMNYIVKSIQEFFE